MMKQVNEQYVGDTSKGLDKAWNELQYEVGEQLTKHPEIQKY